MKKPELPPYLLSVISQDLPVRRARWDRERVFGRKPPKVGPWKPTPPDAADIGLLVSVDAYGAVMQTKPCDTPQGVIAVDDGYLVARHNVLEFWNETLSYEHDYTSHTSFNDLHSIRLSEHGGMVVAASGTDSITEISPSGEVRWLWWGAEHGFDTDSFGNRREISKFGDHREILYDTWLQATHVNSALALGPDAVLATLFHQGCLACIDRHTGKTLALLDGLSRPHAVRWRPGVLSLADTVKGTGLVCSVTGEEGPAAGVRVQVERRIDVRTKWLQDWHALEEGVFVAVDGERPAVVFLTEDGEVIRRDEFNPDWYLYEVAMRSAHQESRR